MKSFDMCCLMLPYRSIVLTRVHVVQGCASADAVYMRTNNRKK